MSENNQTEVPHPILSRNDYMHDLVSQEPYEEDSQSVPESNLVIEEKLKIREELNELFNTIISEHFRGRLTLRRLGQLIKTVEIVIDPLFY